MMTESIGKRIARLRHQQGWTQRELAARVAISRVALSHLEMDLSVPGERTIALLAGWFKISPDDLVAGTTYPPAKADRLPVAVCQYTRFELDLALLANDLGWLVELERLPGHERRTAALWERWSARLVAYTRQHLGEEESRRLAEAQQALRERCFPDR